MRRAVVLGGSIAGMCAARALATVFDEVTLVERDELGTEPGTRSGAPQSRHAHVLLDRGKRDLEALFPGFMAALSDAGVDTFDPGLHLATWRRPGWADVGALGIDFVWASRALVEFTIRAQLRQISGIRFVERTKVVGLLVRQTPKATVVGAKLRTAAGALTDYEADLVVDATGRNTHCDEWFRQAQCAPVTRDTVNAHCGYASRIYQSPQPVPPGMSWKALSVEWQCPTLPRAGMVCPIEGGRWFVTLSGIRPDYPPVDEAGFHEFMRSLASPALADAVALATPVSDIAGSRQLANIFRRYETWSTPLTGFLAIGDAVCALNPVYAQGMSLAAASARVLQDRLRVDRVAAEGFETRFFRAQSVLLRRAWSLATRADFAWPGTEGSRPLRVPIVDHYMRFAMLATHHDSSLRPLVAPVFNLTGPLALYFSPNFVLRAVASTALRRSLQAFAKPRPRSTAL